MTRFLSFLMVAVLLAGAVSAGPAGKQARAETNTAAVTPQHFWSGTAPFCSASANDCTANNFYSWGASASGDGGVCATGWKYLCASRPIADYAVSVVGTSPICAASCGDCPQGYACWIPTNSGISDAGGGGVCVSGEKWICIKPVN